MKKKVRFFATIGLLMLFSAKEIGASDMNEDIAKDFIDGDAVEIEEGVYEENNTFSDESTINDSCSEIMDGPILSDSFGDFEGYLEKNRYYDVLSLGKNDNSSNNGMVYYTFKVNIPDDGRVRVLVEDCNSNALPNFTFESNKTENGWRLYTYDWWETGTDSYDSGWITLKPGEYSGYVAHANWWGSAVNREAKLIIKYETLDEYNGEFEDNNTFDQANLIEHNTVYEGNIRLDDKDYYKFQMESAGLVNITGQNLRNNPNSYIELNIYEEDEYGNVYEIAKAKNKKRLRLGPGNYFIKIENTMQYSLRADVTYESSDTYEQERNNVKSYANDIELDNWYTGNFNTQNDVDYFKFYLNQDEDLTLQFKVPRQTYERSAQVTLYDANLQELDSLSNTENPYAETKEKKYSAGIYYVKAENLREFEEDYSICIKKRQKILVEQIILPTSMNLYIGDYNVLTPEMLPENAENQNLVWSSNNSETVSVNSYGGISAKSSGVAVITAKALDGSGAEASIVINVSDKANILDMYFSNVGSQEYTGKSLKPAVEVKNGSKTLTQNVDYKVTYKNNKKIGTASIIVQGIGNYVGTKTIKFNITPKKAAISSVVQAGDGKLTISWKKASYAQGYVLYRSTKKNGTYSKIKTITDVNRLSYTNSGLKSGTKYYYKIKTYRKVNGKNIYSDFSTAKYGTTKKVQLDGTYTGSNAKITIYQNDGKYYAKAYGRGGKMNTTVVLHQYSSGYRAYYSSGDTFFEISDISARKIYVKFPLISEFSGWYTK